MLEKILEIDTQLFTKINSWNSTFFDTVMSAISGKLFWLPFFIFIVFLFFKKDKKKSLFVLFFLIFAVGLADYLSVHAFKEVFKRLRPCHNPDIANFVHLIKGHCGGKYGFVSSHAANFFSIAMFSSLYIQKKWFYFLSFTIALFVAYSRVYLGVHYPSDVFGGALLGMLIAFIVYKISTKIYINARNNFNIRNSRNNWRNNRK
ncbi:MAG: phosphatase PAP2 family protein [Bacteroidales bacterium]|nr:phosphatase PAP2 family protein [Bacteroidales bacterium]